MFDSNVYYHPEMCGLMKVDELEAGEYYGFDTLVVWKDEHGKKYWAHDSGCSCPTPFDGMTKIEHLYPLPETRRELVEQADRMAVSESDKIAFLTTVGA